MADGVIGVSRAGVVGVALVVVGLCAGSYLAGRRRGPDLNGTENVLAPGAGGEITDHPSAGEARSPATASRGTTVARTPDGGVAPPVAALGSSACAAIVLADSRALLEVATHAHRNAVHSCQANYRTDYSGAYAPYLPDPRDTCGALSEELWNSSRTEIDGPVNALLTMAGGDGAILFADAECSSMTDDEFGAALHVLSAAPARVSREFVECSVRREREHEAFPLWTLLTAARDYPGAREWLSGVEFEDERTTRRLADLD